MDERPPTPTSPAPPSYVQRAPGPSFPEFDDAHLYQASPSFCRAEKTRKGLWRHGYRPRVDDTRDWFRTAIWKTCDVIMHRAVKFQLRIADHRTSASDSRVSVTTAEVDQVVADFYKAIEVEGSIGFNYLYEPNYQVLCHELDWYYLTFFEDYRDKRLRKARRIREGAIEKFMEYLSKPRVLPTMVVCSPRANFLQAHSIPTANGQNPCTVRMAMIDQSLLRMEQLAVAPQDEPRERFYKDFVQQIGASVKDKVYANHDSLLDLTSYIRITGELARFNGDTLLQTWELRCRLRPTEWRAFKDRGVKAFVKRLFPAAPPYSEHALCHHGRIGFRQPDLRPDLKVLGPAQHGGYLF
ncbi:hypothetical protein JCM16303_003295 [Sporobolomyces ruberrimus]